MISIIAAIGENRELGKDNKLLWQIAEDLKRFKQITAGHPVIMGRKTYESIGRPLPKRVNIVITRDRSYKPVGCTVAHSLDEALAVAQKIDPVEIFVIGGGEIYKQALDQADKLYLTLVKGTYEADAYFPEYTAFDREILREEHFSDRYTFTYVILERSLPGGRAK